MDGRDPKTGEEPQGIIRGLGMTGALPDVLSSDGKFIYMRHKRFNREFVEQEPNDGVFLETYDAVIPHQWL